MLIQKLRLKRGWSQQQLAELSGLSVRTIQRIENGNQASTETLKSLASVFDIDFSELTSEPPMTDQKQLDNDERLERLAFAHVRKVRCLYSHVIRYMIVIAALFVINIVTAPQYLWAKWPALGWGIGVMMHAVNVFWRMPFFGADWERRQVEKRLGRPL